VPENPLEDLSFQVESPLPLAGETPVPFGSVASNHSCRPEILLGLNGIVFFNNVAMFY
jgi:hypothetical protein